ncbi:GAF domain-containing protein [Oscillatoria sp. FACHB-1407]|nr:GAF domain-containing protein [Oscillatoria sp. FACHB-1407]
MKAAQALSREIVLDQLLVTLMNILIENTGAERGYLILEKDEQFFIEAEGTANSPHIEVLHSIPLTPKDTIDHASVDIIHFVAQTHENIILGDISKAQRLFRQPIVVRPRSVLCVPLINQNKLTGIIYLENTFVTDAFTDSHLEIVQLLSAQAAIAIDNARLYNELEARVQQRTADLVRTNQILEREVLERQRSEQTLRLIVEATAGVTRKDFFHSLVRSLAQALDVYYAFITECDSNAPTRLRTIACWYQNEFIENFEYDVYGTACEQVINSQTCQCYPDQLQLLFPEDDSLPEMKAQSYAGVALRDSSGKLLGHLAVLDDQPLADIPRSTAILEIFAARAAAEMERQQAEAVIRASQEKFSKAFRSSPSGITITTIKEGRFLEVNDSFLRMLGYEHEEVIGQSAFDLNIWVKTDDRATITRLLQEQGTVSNVEVELRRKSGDTFLALVSADIIDLDGEPCLLGVTTDITVLKQAAKALERLAEIGELASMIVHEVRNPLTTMVMGLGAFKRLELSGRFQEYLALALDEGDRLQRLLNQILLYAKPQTLNQIELDLTSLITETLHTLRDLPVASTKPLRFNSAATAAPVLGDRDKLKQVLINLVTNACEAVDDGAVITVSLQRDQSNQIVVQVHNTGDPIPPDILVKLTKPFFTTKTNGNGLGLAIVKRIVEAHHGELCIESSAEVGTTVTVRLPGRR